MRAEKDFLVVADAGGTKTQWWVWNPSMEDALLFEGDGINATVSAEEDILASVSSFRSSLRAASVIPDYGRIDVHFYGAGCNSESACAKLDKAFKDVFGEVLGKCHYASDLLGAARALFGPEEGIACILGTGSASCLYAEGDIIDSIPSLGFILGDEGSGARMGCQLLNMYFKRELSPELAHSLEAFTDLRLPAVLEEVYRRPGANRKLASLVPFIKRNENLPQISALIDSNLKLFFSKNVSKYKVFPSRTIRFAGGVASIFKNRLVEMASEYGLKADRFADRPVAALGEYHKNIYLHERL